jgi:SAM-dependent methyltransferase
MLGAVLKKPRRLLRRLRGVEVPSHLSNVEYNRAYWDLYARSWNKGRVEVENPAVISQQRSAYLTHLGDEWGSKADVERIVAEYILPFVTPQSVVGEIGIGGARIASRIAGCVGRFYGFDVSAEMLKRARRALADHARVEYVLLAQPRFEASLAGHFDFLYSFDVFVHLDLHTIWTYLQEIAKALKRGGKTFLHVTNLTTQAGWARFAAQERYRAENCYFVCPELIDILVSHAGLRMIKRSQPDPANFYLNRDDLFVLEKP